jgi:hypothetical protein
MARPKLTQRKTRPGASATSPDDFGVYSTYRYEGAGRYFGVLKVVRKTDGRMLFPFDGAPEIGPFSTAKEARGAADEYGAKIVAADLANPEP